MPTFTLYSFLGVEKTASVRQIRAAYRRLAKTLHPDVGGNIGEFNKLKLAHDILCDPARRKKYDATGEIDEGTANNANAITLGIITQAMDLAMMEFLKAGVNLKNADFMATVRAKLDERITTLEKGLLIADQARKAWEDAITRFRTKKKDAPNQLQILAQAKITGLQTQIEKYKQERDAVRKARQLSDDYDYAFSPMTGRMTATSFPIFRGLPFTTFSP